MTLCLHFDLNLKTCSCLSLPQKVRFETFLLLEHIMLEQALNPRVVEIKHFLKTEAPVIEKSCGIIIIIIII